MGFLDYILLLLYLKDRYNKTLDTENSTLLCLLSLFLYLVHIIYKFLGIFYIGTMTSLFYIKDREEKADSYFHLFFLKLFLNDPNP